MRLLRNSRGHKLKRNLNQVLDMAICMQDCNKQSTEIA